MTDLTAIAAAVQAMLETVDGFQLVEHSSARRAPEYVPSAVHYFAGSGESDNAAIDQVLTWGINLYAPVMDASEGNQHALELIEAVGAAVDAWASTISGRCLPAVLAEARIAEVTDTLLTYYLELRLSVPAAATANTATGDSLLNAIRTEVQSTDPVALLQSSGDVFARYDLQDLSSLFQDDVGAVPVYRPGTGQPDPVVALILDQSGNGNHARQTDPAKRARLSGRYNLLGDTEYAVNSAAYQYSIDGTVYGGANAVQVTSTGAPGVTRWGLPAYPGGAFRFRMFYRPVAATTLVFAVRNNTTLTNLIVINSGQASTVNTYGTATNEAMGDGWSLVTITVTAGTAAGNSVSVYYGRNATGAGGESWYVAAPDVRIVSGVAAELDTLPPYQRVVNANTYDTAGFPLYLRPDRADDQFALAIPAGGVAGILVMGEYGGATVADVDLTEGEYLYPSDPTTGPDHIRQWVLFTRGLTAGERAAVEMWVEYGVQVALSTYLCPEAGYRPACVGVPSLGIRPAGVTREEISGCSYDARYQVELIAHVEADGSTSAASVLDAAIAVLINNLLGIAGVGACRPMDDGTPGLVRDEHGRWLVRASRMIEYTISESY